MRALGLCLLTVTLAAAAEAALRLARHGWTAAALGAFSAAPPWERLRRLGPTGEPEPVPGGAASWALAPGEPRIGYRLNALGLREEREVAPLPAPGTCRILAVGDAYTFGYGVLAADAYPRVLERRLARRGRFEVLNAGFPNIDVEQQRRRLAWLLPRVHPQLVLASFDWWNVPPEDGADPGPRRWSRAWFIAQLEEKSARLGAESALVHEALRLLRQRLTPALFPPSGLARELEPLTLPAAALAGRWARTRAAIAGMRDDADAAGARFAVVLVPLDLQIDRARNELYRNGRLPYPSHGFADIDYRRDVEMPDALRRFAAASGIPLIDVTPAFEAHGGVRLFLARDYHAAPAGHRVIAHEVARWIERTGTCGPALHAPPRTCSRRLYGAASHPRRRRRMHGCAATVGISIPHAPVRRTRLLARDGTSVA